MKFLIRATMEVEAGNHLCRDKEMNQKMEAVMSDVRPESVYFGIEKGQRTVLCLVNVESASDIPRIAEPFWLAFKANVEFTPVMSSEDFKRAVPHIENAARKFSWT